MPHFWPTSLRRTALRTFCTAALALIVTSSAFARGATGDDLKLKVRLDGYRGSGCTLLASGGKLLPELDLGTKTAPATPFTLSFLHYDPTEDGSLGFMAADFLKERPTPKSAVLAKPCRLRVTVESETDQRIALIISKVKVPYYWLLEHNNHVEHSAEISAKLQELGESPHAATMQATVTDDDALLIIDLAPSFGSSCAKSVTFDFTLTVFLKGNARTKTHSQFTVPSLQPITGTVRKCPSSAPDAREQ